MATVSVRVPEDLKAKMEKHDDINWSAVLRQHIEDEIAHREVKNVARAAATSERLSQQVSPEDTGDPSATEIIREFRDSRYGGES